MIQCGMGTVYSILIVIKDIVDCCTKQDWGNKGLAALAKAKDSYDLVYIDGLW